MKATILHCLILFILLIGQAECHGQLIQKELQAFKTETKLNIDGYLDETAWESAEIATDFTQTEPVFPAVPTQKSEIRILYTDKGIYVGALLHDTHPDLILKELSQRDQRNNTDWFGVIFDTYRDGLNGFAFNITAAGVQQDVKVSGGEEQLNWDGIWESEVRIHDKGWTAELFIPYLSLRFPNVEIQEWNVNFLREIRRNREQVYWNPIDPKVDGFINQSGKLNGIRDIKSPVRLSLTPFVTGYINTVSNSSDPQQNGASTAYTGGMDLKYGINDAFTLDMTLVPDFGQVISDNLVLNLSPFEIFFEENRQFFTEGVELFNKGNLFYSRRIGGRPYNSFLPNLRKEENEIIISNPDVAQLYNATKISGRMKSGTGLGFFNAVEGSEFAILEDTLTGLRREIQTNTLTNYNVMVVDQNLPNNSVVTLINTNVIREGDAPDANVTGGFFSVRDKSQNYRIGGKAVVSNVIDPDHTTTGHSFSIGGGKVGGNWRATIDYNEESDTYDPNDLGLLFSNNERSFFGSLSYVDFTPKNQKLQRWEVGIRPSYSRIYNPNEFSDFAININTFILWKSRNAIGFNGRIEPVTTYDFFEPRTFDFSQSYAFPTNWFFGGFFSSDYRKTFALDVNSLYRKFNEPGRSYFEWSFRPKIRVNDKLSFFGDISYANSSNDVGWVNRSFVQGGVDNLDGRILFGTRDRQTIENTIRIQYIFNNKMFLTGRIRHYWDKVKYSSFGGLESDGSVDRLSFDGYDENNDAIFDTNVNFFNVDINYTWRFNKGSDLIFVWKQSISDTNKELDNSYFKNLSDTFNAFQTNSISLKIVYFLDYNSVVNSN